MMNEKFEISSELRNALMQYFSARPWSEAESFMHALGDLKPVPAAVKSACEILADNNYVDA